VRIIDTGKLAVFQRFRERGLDVNTVLTRPTDFGPRRVPLLVYVAYEAHPVRLAMAKQLFETGKLDISGWSVSGW
jgi:hypothetical protein